MPVQVGVGYVTIKPDMAGFSRDLKRGMSQDLAVAGDAGGKTLGAGVSAGFKKAAAIGGVGLGAAAGANFLKGAVNASSDLEEALSKTNFVFKESAAEISAWAEGGAKNFGLSKRAALDAASGFGNMFGQLGIGLDAAAGMSTSIVELAADFASFHNADISQVLDAQAAAFRGEYDSLQRFLPLINAATVEQKALAMTGKTATKELTAQEKALAVNALMLEGAGEAAGDFDRTADSLANKQRVLAAEAENAASKLGDALSPSISKVVGFVTDVAIPAFLWFGEVIGEGVADAVGFAVGALADLLSVAAKALEKVDQFIPGMEGVPERLKEAVDEMRSWEASAHDLQSAFGGVNHAVDDQAVAVAGLGAEVKDLVSLTLEATTTQRDLERATRDLGAANRDRADAQKDLNTLIARGAVDEEAVADARERLADATRAASGADRDLAKAQKAYDEALANANDLRGYDTAQEALAEAADQLADAQDRATDAHEAAADAQKELTRAQAGDPEYQDKLADARDRVADATDRVADAEKEVAERSADAVAAHDAETAAIKLKADELARLREEMAKVIELSDIARAGGLNLDPGFVGPFSPQQLLGAKHVVPPGFVGPLSPTQVQGVDPGFVGPLDTDQARYTPPKVNNVTINVTQTDPSPQKLAHEMTWALN